MTLVSVGLMVYIGTLPSPILCRMTHTFLDSLRGQEAAAECHLPIVTAVLPLHAVSRPTEKA